MTRGVELSDDISPLDGEGEHEGGQESEGGKAGGVSHVLVTQIVVTEANIY